ncbi:MAG: hypothetical protein BWX74_00859 [Tenericutes bacterium ADurb.Bin087]|nr:MAG: hypothetical protein BWX74_00859 [Tenericutes bacterium ADurb.Bin087]
MAIQEKRTKSKLLKSKKIQLFLTFFGVATSAISLTIVTHAWFLSVRNAGVDNPNVEILDEYARSFSYALNGVPIEDEIIEFTPFYPGHVHRKTLTFSLTNLSAHPFFMDLYFNNAGSLDEAPYLDTEGKWGNANYYYYLGSQIALTAVSLSIDGATPTYTSGAGNYLVQTNSVGVTKGQVNGVASAVTSIPRFNIFQNVTIPASKTLSGTIEFTFVDNGTDQSMYFIDWPTTGVSKRQMYAHFYRGA